MARMVQCVYLKKGSPGPGLRAALPWAKRAALSRRHQPAIAFEIWKRHQTMLVRNENRPTSAPELHRRQMGSNSSSAAMPTNLRRLCAACGTTSPGAYPGAKRGANHIYIYMAEQSRSPAMSTTEVTCWRRRPRSAADRRGAAHRARAGDRQVKALMARKVRAERERHRRGAPAAAGRRGRPAARETGGQVPPPADRQSTGRAAGSE